MARLARAAERLLSDSSKTIINHGIRSYNRSAASTSILQFRPFATDIIQKSPLRVNILRILRDEIEYHFERPLRKPDTKFTSFTVEDRPGEVWIAMSGKYGDNEEIKIEVTMFDGCIHVPRTGEDATGYDVRHHLTLAVDVSKGQGCDELEFVCSAWPDSLEIQKVFMLKRGRMRPKPYLGPDFRKLNVKLQKTLREFLEARGVNDELCAFLHDYMMYKDRIELIRWLRNVKSFVEM